MQSDFLTDREGRPLCTRCNINRIVAENGNGEFWCFRCFMDEGYEDGEYEIDDTLIVCPTELARQAA